MDDEATWASKDAAEVLADIEALRRSLLVSQARDDLAELRARREERRRARAEELLARFERMSGELVGGAKECCPHCQQTVARICHTPAEWMACPRMPGNSSSEPSYTFVVPSGPREFGTDSPAYEFVGVGPGKPQG